MASQLTDSPFDLTKGEDLALTNHYKKYGMGADFWRKVLKYPDVLKMMLAGAMEHPEFMLVHDVFTPGARVMAAMSARLVAENIGTGQFTWQSDTKPLEFTDDPEVAVVLDLTLGSLEDTIEFAARWMASVHPNFWRWDSLKTDAENMRLLLGSEPFQPFTMRWRRIKLDGHPVGTAPQTVRNSFESPRVAAILAGAQHPARVSAIDYETRFGWWVPGLECTAPDDDSWRDSPYVSWNRDGRQAGLRACWSDSEDDNLVVPVLQE